MKKQLKHVNNAYDGSADPPLRTRFSAPNNRTVIGYVADKIIERMEAAGYRPKVFEIYRPPGRQNDLYVLGRSKAKAYQSPHQYYQAVDIVHADLYWEAPPSFWEALNRCVKSVQADTGVELEHGHEWKFVDSAHVEIKHWREFARKVGRKKPTDEQLSQQYDKLIK